LHELGVVIEVVKNVDEFAKANGVSKIDTIVLQIGELSSMIPKYIKDCYPVAVDGTDYEETKLEIEILPGNGRCLDCSKIFNILKSKSTCPDCESRNWEMLSGKEFMIKEIVAC
jgi:hydrogenase nickel incorporation protein HypA/HybF